MYTERNIYLYAIYFIIYEYIIIVVEIKKNPNK